MEGLRYLMTTIQKDRFDNDEMMFRRIINMVTRSDQVLPPYEADTRKRDEALQHFWRSESLIASVLAASVARDKNRAWTLTGGARLVSNFAKKLHTVHNNEGWRQFLSLNSTAWYSSNLGYVSEIGVDGNKVSDTMWHVDPSRLRMTGARDYPMYYYPATGKKKLRRETYIHGNSMPAVQEKLNYAGFCAIERALLFTRLMIGLHYHQLEKLGVAPPKGILFATGVGRQEWDSAVANFQQEKENQDTATYDGVFGLFVKDPNAKLDLIGLSELPDNFNLRDWLDNIMKAYSLAFGTNIYQFWTPESGTFGRGREIDAMRKNTTYMGELEFALSFQDQIQSYFLPPSVLFDFNMRNDDDTLAQEEINALVIANIKSMKDSELIDAQEGRYLLAKSGILPRDWIAGIEDKSLTVTDLQHVRQRARDNFEIRRFAKTYPDEPIITYSYNSKREIIGNYDAPDKLYEYEFPNGNVEVLYKNGDEMLRKRAY
jgi:hypothetical protein